VITDQLTTTAHTTSAGRVNAVAEALLSRWEIMNGFLRNGSDRDWGGLEHAGLGRVEKGQDQ